MWLITNLKLVAAVTATLILSYALHAIVAGLTEARHEAAMREQATLYVKQCEADKTKIKEANDAIQKDAHDIAARLVAYKRLYPGTCVVPTDHATKLATGGAGHAGADGVSTDWLREFAATCEEYRRQRVVLEGLFE